jgi:cysteinyl-tRNA synthetase
LESHEEYQVKASHLFADFNNKILGYQKYAARRLTLSDLQKVAVAIDDGRLNESIARRLAFIRDKNWAEADRIRDELLAQGIQLKDGKDPATGERVTTWEVKR